MSVRIKWCAQLTTVMLCALGLKFFYSTASADQLRWILGPTTWLVETLSGQSFTFEAHAGYMRSDHRFLIAASCAGVNFLITSFLMLGLRSLFRRKFGSLPWRLIPVSLGFAYLTTIVANTVRICIAVQLPHLSEDIRWLDPGQLHRVEGILIYFGFLIFLFLLTETSKTTSAFDLLKKLRMPLLIYYATTMGIPLANGAYKQNSEFWQHIVFVLVIPVCLTLLLVTYNLCRTLLLDPLRKP